MLNQGILLSEGDKGRRTVKPVFKGHSNERKSDDQVTIFQNNALLVFPMLRNLRLRDNNYNVGTHFPMLVKL